MKVKKILLGMFAMASMLFVTACSQNELKDVNVEGDYVTATFNVATPDGINSRAIGDGTTVNYVVCATFDENGEEMTALRKYEPIVDKKAKYSIRLVKGQNYRVAFFAYNGNGEGKSNYYNFADMKNITISDARSNLEGRDAFTAYRDIVAGATMQPIEEDVFLYRPFAQLNIGSYYDDWSAAVAAGVTVNQTKVTVSNVYKAFSAYEDVVVGDTESMTFELNTLPNEDLLADVDNNGEDEAYKYLALNYLLVGDKQNEKNLTDITFEWSTEDGKTNDPVTTFKNIPVQRNYRTNIIGWMLTNPADFNIIIDEEFEKPDYNIIAIDGTVTTGGNMEMGGTDGYLDEPETVATIKNKHITADGTAIVVEDLPEAARGVLYIANTIVNAETFLELNEYVTVIVRNCQLNVQTLLKNNTEHRSFQIVFDNCYINGQPLTEENIDQYVNESEFGTINVYFKEG